MLSPTPDRFRGLARSSPWRWRALAFDLHRRPLHGPDHTVHALVQRGVGLQVRLADGAQRREPARRGTAGMIRLGGGERGPDAVELPYAWEVPVEVDADGFVVRRPPGSTSDDPMWQDYQFVAMLDPVELADGRWRPPVPDADSDAVAPDAVAPHAVAPDAAPPPALDVHRLDAVVRSGRPTWWAEVTPRPEYDPRCPCCPLLFGEVSEDLEILSGGTTLRERKPWLTYATRYLVALDVVTGICVHVEHLDGDHAGRGFSVEIHAVDGGVAKSVPGQ